MELSAEKAQEVRNQPSEPDIRDTILKESMAGPHFQGIVEARDRYGTARYALTVPIATDKKNHRFLPRATLSCPKFWLLRLSLPWPSARGGWRTAVQCRSLGLNILQALAVEATATLISILLLESG